MRARVVVIGGGAFGASCFYHLTARGVRDVTLLEQATLGSGSTGRSAAVVETQYLAPDQVALCAWSIRVFQRLEQEHGLPFVHHGYLRLGHSAADVVGLPRERDAPAGPRARRRARDRARRGRADRAGATRGRPGRGPVGSVGRLRRRRALLRAARRSRTGGRRSRRPGTARDRAPAPGWPRDGRRVRRRDDRVRDRGQRQRRVGTPTGRRARIDAARRRLPSAAGPVRAAAASRGPLSRW